eukprot:6175918-Pleurochrysis_carterae.AAC.1
MLGRASVCPRVRACASMVWRSEQSCAWLCEHGSLGRIMHSSARAHERARCEAARACTRRRAQDEHAKNGASKMRAVR